MKQILVIDDDIHIGNLLEEILTKEGYGVSRAYSGTEALLVLSVRRPDLVLLDLMLPGLCGEEVLPKLAGIPVIVLSAETKADKKAELLLGGAADYMTKPFDRKELLARITVQMRSAAARNRTNVLEYEEILMDTGLRQVKVSGQTVKLTRTEYAVLKLLMQNAAQVVTKSVMLDRICEDTPDCMESSLKVHVSNLRRKLKDIGGKDYIEAVWGIGFKMRESIGA
ncbi:MAG: response regulator transcription factor [Lachnospiraceae bacterium]|nr:response regulator transcription factor [Lachnospiraceae bacterium]MCI9659474.1 response regulator transcription factor [Lachnospiraceae bacterium]